MLPIQTWASYPFEGAVKYTRDDGWISVKNGLPPEGEGVLIAHDGSYPSMRKWVGIGVLVDSDIPKWVDTETDGYNDPLEWNYEVTHWRYLPEAP